jgi:tyramine---L-glutamate ligase
MRRVFVYEYLSGGGLPGQAGHELLDQGLAMRDAMVRDLQGCTGWAVSVATDGPAQRVPAGAARVWPRPGESAPAFVARVAARHDAVWLVAPESDGVLAQLAAEVMPARWLGCEREAIALASSKRATLRCCAAHGLDTPLRADVPAACWVVKPDDGCGATDTRVHRDHAAACRDRDARGAWLEPWVEGEALSASLLCTPDGVQLLAVNRQLIVVADDGALHFEGVAVDAVRDARRPRIAAFAQQVARAVGGLRGFVGIDFVWHATRGPVLIEVNPRVTSAYVDLSAALGRNVAAGVLAARVDQAEHV